MLGKKAGALGEPSQITSKQSLGLCRVNTASEGRGSLGLVTTQNRICCLKIEEWEESGRGRETRLGRAGAGWGVRVGGMGRVGKVRARRPGLQAPCKGTAQPTQQKGSLTAAFLKSFWC